MSLTRPLSAVEIRVLGALMEKEQTTPDHYPLTVNALLAACNQKTNREPVTSLTETEVVEALDALRADVLAWRSPGARAEHWEHRLDRRWHLDAQSKAVMTLLMLRGPQTPGELKSRGERMGGFGSVAEVEQVLARLAEGGDDALVEELARQPGQRETRWAHRVGSEPETLPEPAESAPPSRTAPTRPAGSAPPRATGEISDRLDRLETAVARLEEQLTALRRRLGDLD